MTQRELGDGAGLLSLSMPRLGPDIYVRYDKGLVYRSSLPPGGSSNGAAMDASFRLVPSTKIGCAHVDGRHFETLQKCQLVSQWDLLDSQSCSVRSYMQASS